MRWGTLGEDSVRVLGSSKGWDWVGLGLGDGLERVLVSVAVRGSIVSDGLEKVLIGTWGPRESFLGGWKGRAAKNSVSASGANTLGPVSPVQLTV